MIDSKGGEEIYVKTEMEGGEAGTRCANRDTELEISRERKSCQKMLSHRERSGRVQHCRRSAEMYQ